MSAFDQVVSKTGDFKVDHLQMEEKYYSTAMRSADLLKKLGENPCLKQIFFLSWCPQP